jgi:ABC-type branched-subunit amino acid transport system ATPase component
MAFQEMKEKITPKVRISIVSTIQELHNNTSTTIVIQYPF